MSDNYIKLISMAMPALLARLKPRGIDLGICSNNNEYWFRRQYFNLGLDQYFSPNKVTLFYRVGYAKASERHEMLTATVRAMGISPSNCIFIDDRVNNIEHAIEFGFNGIPFVNFDQFQMVLDAVRNSWWMLTKPRIYDFPRTALPMAQPIHRANSQ